jgi:hypothetical protein
MEIRRNVAQEGRVDLNTEAELRFGISWLEGENERLEAELKLLRDLINWAQEQVTPLRTKHDELLAACETILAEPDYEPDGDADGYWRGCDNESRRLARIFKRILSGETVEKGNAT